MNEKLIIPVSIVVAGAIVGGAIFFSNSTPNPVANNNQATGNQEQQPQEQQTTNAKKVDPSTDHIYGNSNADLFVIEYSDLECPFCKRYHDTALSQLKAEFADEPRVAFVFRHFPLDEPFTRALHPTATEEAIAAECVAKLGDNDKFNAFVDKIFATTNSDGRYPLENLAGIAEGVGVNKAAFTTCYENEETADIVAASFAEGAAAGVQGTPTVMVQTKDGETYPAVPDYNALKTAIEVFLNEE